VFCLLDAKGETKAFVDNKTFERIEDFVGSQKKCFMPSKGTLIIETLENYKVLYTGLGTKANEALARLLASIYSAKLGSSINVKASPYLIFIELPRETDIGPVLKSLKPELLEGAMKDIVENTELFRYQFVAVACAEAYWHVHRNAGARRNA
jgi:Lhr-like helicase